MSMPKASIKVTLPEINISWGKVLLQILKNSVPNGTINGVEKIQ